MPLELDSLPLLPEYLPLRPGHPFQHLDPRSLQRWTFLGQNPLSLLCSIFLDHGPGVAEGRKREAGGAL